MTSSSFVSPLDCLTSFLGISLSRAVSSFGRITNVSKSAITAESYIRSWRKPPEIPEVCRMTRIGRHFHCYYYFSTSFSKELQIYHIRWCLWCKPPGNLVCPTDVIWFRSHSSDCRKMAEYMVRHSSVSLSVITFSTQNILELYFGR